MSDFIMILPIKISPAMLSSSNINENDHAEWSAVTAYVAGTRVIRLNTHKIYECAVNNTNKIPENNIYDGEADPPTGYWKEISATNRWRMFDNKTQSASTNASTITSIITPGLLFNAICFRNIEAHSLQIVINDPVDGEIYNNDIDLLDLTFVKDFYDWFFSPLQNKSDVNLLDLPAYPTGTITTTLQNNSGDAQIGELVIGEKRILGSCEWGTGLGLVDFSKKEKNPEDGSVSIKEGIYAKTVDYQIRIPRNAINYTYQTLVQYRATPVIFIGSEDMEEIGTYGFFIDLSITHETFGIKTCTLQVEELS